jgi:signal transduction histidine kinase
MTGWWQRRSLRVRLVLIGVVGLIVGFVLGGLLLVGVLGLVLQRSVDGEAQQTATAIAALVDSGRLPEPIPVVGSDQVQVVDAQGRVRATSLQADRLVAMVRPDDLAKVRGGRKVFRSGNDLGLEGPVRVVGAPAGPADDPQTVLVARSMADAMKGVQLLRLFLLIVFPLLVAALAAVAWRVVGATLRPVEQLRRGAEEISASNAGAGRLPVPGGDDEIRRLALTLNGMIDRLEASRTRQREFVADAAHELRSPLANIRTQLEVAQRLGPAADWPSVSEDLLTDTTRLGRLVDDLLLLARSDAARPLAAKPVDLDDLVREVGDHHPPTTVSTPHTPVWTLGERDALMRIVANLVENAVRHARTGVELAVMANGDRALVTVTDDGPGIPPADRERVFERFTRLDDGRARDAGGAGLGLAIVRELVRRHRGTVRLADRPDGAPGLRVEVDLPLAPSKPRER